MKLILLLTILSFCQMSMTYNAEDCDKNVVKVVNKMIKLDTAYQCSTFVITKDTAVLLEVRIIKGYPEMLKTICKEIK